MIGSKYARVFPVLLGLLRNTLFPFSMASMVYLLLASYLLLHLSQGPTFEMSEPAEKVALEVRHMQLMIK